MTDPSAGVGNTSGTETKEDFDRKASEENARKAEIERKAAEARAKDESDKRQAEKARVKTARSREKWIAGIVAFWCTILATIDAYMSMSAIVGLMGEGLVGLVFGVLFGVGLTLVLSTFRSIKEGLGLGVGFYVVLAPFAIFDFLTTFVGAVWYGAMKHEINTPVIVPELHFGWDNVHQVAMWTAFAAWVMLGCVGLGWSTHVLFVRKPDSHYLRVRDKRTGDDAGGQETLTVPKESASRSGESEDDSGDNETEPPEDN